MRLNKTIFALFPIVLLLICTEVQAKFVEAEGSAQIKNGAIGSARELAVQNAIKQAMIQSNVQVATSTLISSNALVADSSRFRSYGKVKDVVVLSEWVDSDYLFVRIRAEVDGSGSGKHKPSSRYRKKLAALQFHIEDRRHTADLANVEFEWPREILRMLENGGLVLAVDGTKYNLYSYLQHGQGITDKEVIIKIADNLDCQFVLFGVVRDMSVDSRFLSHQRKLEIDTYLYDGVTGAMIARHRFSDHVAGEGYNLASNRFATEGFYRTKLGSTIRRVMSRQVALISDDLEQLPFVARVLRTEGNMVFFNAGGLAQVQPGDTLMSYRLANEALIDPEKGHFFGYPEEPVATLLVKQVQPLFAVGILEGENVSLRAGDIIRFGW